MYRWYTLEVYNDSRNRNSFKQVTRTQPSISLLGQVFMCMPLSKVRQKAWGITDSPGAPESYPMRVSRKRIHVPWLAQLGGDGVSEVELPKTWRAGTKNMQTEALKMSLFAVMMSHSLPLLATVIFNHSSNKRGSRTRGWLMSLTICHLNPQLLCSQTA